MEDLIAIETGDVKCFSGTLYVRLPRLVAKDAKKGDLVTFLRGPKSDDTVIRIEKPSVKSKR